MKTCYLKNLIYCDYLYVWTCQSRLQGSFCSSPKVEGQLKINLFAFSQHLRMCASKSWARCFSLWFGLRDMCLLPKYIYKLRKHAKLLWGFLFETMWTAWKLEMLKLSCRPRSTLWGFLGLLGGDLSSDVLALWLDLHECESSSYLDVHLLQ